MSEFAAPGHIAIADQREHERQLHIRLGQFGRVFDEGARFGEIRTHHAGATPVAQDLDGEA